MIFPTAIRTKGSSVRRLMRSTQEALRFIDSELAVELRSQARWKFARELLVVAEKSGAISSVRIGNSDKRLGTICCCTKIRTFDGIRPRRVAGFPCGQTQRYPCDRSRDS